MKKKYLLSPILLLVSCAQLFGQQKNMEEVYTSYFELPREALHIHLNKTTFLH